MSSRSDARLPKKFPYLKKRWMTCLVEKMLGRTLTVQKQTAPNATMGEHTLCKFRSDQQMNRCQLSTSVVIISASSGGVRIDICCIAIFMLNTSMDCLLRSIHRKCKGKISYFKFI